MAHEPALIDDLMAVIDRHAGREHSRTGSVATALRAVLQRYDTNHAEDRLDFMLRTQREFQEMINGYPLDTQDDETRIENIKTSVLAALDELHEALGEVGWKPWATSRHINTEAFRSELIDVWHFLMNLFLHAGMNGDDITRLYIDKQAKNRARQRNGYDGVAGKCPSCKRSYDDDGVLCTPPLADMGWCEIDGTTVRHLVQS
jgi:dimeric dUTPase (all-alpha-NTP-PPase superfamily)